MELDLPDPYLARPYRGPVDHPAMTAILRAYRRAAGEHEMPTVEQFDVTYANLTNCDPQTDVAIVETSGGEPVAYVRTTWEDLEDGSRDLVVYAPTLPWHLSAELCRALVEGQERHLGQRVATDRPTRFRAYAPHPGPGRPATGEAAWLEAMGYRAVRFGASLVRPHLDAIPESSLPAGVEVRPVTDDQLRTIWEADVEAFREEWDAREPSEADYRAFVDDPRRDVSLWKVAWAGDTVVGQVKSFVVAEENEANGYLRGYTEDISVHADWRNRGIAGALLALSLRELRDRGMTEAALSVDTDNPGGAFQLYTRLGFELQAYEAVYTKPVAVERT